MRNHSTANRPFGFFFLLPPLPLSFSLPLSAPLPFAFGLTSSSLSAGLCFLSFFSATSSPLCLKSEQSVP